MSSFAHHLALALACALLGAAGMRVAAQLTRSGLERAVAAATFAATAATLEALGLGLVGLGGQAIALWLAAGVTWVGARALLPSPQPRASAQLRDWWTLASPAAKAATGAVGGAGLAWAAWLVWVPALGYDSVNYHLPEAVIWVQNGHPGSVISGVLDKVTYLPLVSEVLLSWQVGISRSLVPASLMAPASLLLMVVSAWLGLRTVGVPRAATAAAVAALCATPVLTHYQMNGAYNDLPALAWLVATAALAASSRRRPAMLPAVLLAAALAAGTKTTALPLALFLAGLALWPHRRELRAHAGPLAAASGAALVVGGLWYARDFVVHGSPFWPDVALPWGDPTPVRSPSFLDRPSATLERFGDDYLELFAGAAVMFGGAFLVALTTRQRAVRAAGVVTAISLLLWLNAPATGAAEGSSAVGTLSTLRYVLPALAAAVVTLALATRVPGIRRRLGTLTLTLGLALGAAQTLALGYPSVPGLWIPLLGAALGAGCVLGLAVLGRSAPSGRAARVALTALALAAVSAAMTWGASGFVERHARANAGTVYPYAPLIRWLSEQPRYRSGEDTVAMTPIPNGVVVGDRLQHRFEEIPARESCARVRARLGREWVLVNFLGVVRRPGPARCLEGVRPSFRGPGFRAYRPASAK